MLCQSVSFKVCFRSLSGCNTAQEIMYFFFKDCFITFEAEMLFLVHLTRFHSCCDRNDTRSGSLHNEDVDQQSLGIIKSHNEINTWIFQLLCYPLVFQDMVFWTKLCKLHSMITFYLRMKLREELRYPSVCSVICMFIFTSRNYKTDAISNFCVFSLKYKWQKLID